MKAQRGYTLLEVLVSVAIVLVVSGGVFQAVITAGRAMAADPAREAAQRVLTRLATLAGAATKYAPDDSAFLSGATWSFTAPNPKGTPYPLTVTATQSGTSLTFSVQYPENRGTATLTKTLVAVPRAPAPGSRVTTCGSDPDSTPAPCPTRT